MGGHIFVFHSQELLAWYEPYENFVCFLTCVTAAGPCGLEKCIVASGGKDPKPADQGQSCEEVSKSCGALIMWEAYDAKTLRQIKMVEKNSPGYLDSHSTIRKMIRDGQFMDGTCISSCN